MRYSKAAGNVDFSGGFLIFASKIMIDIDHVYEYTYSDFDKAKIIMEELRKRGEEPEYDLDRTEGDLY